MSPSMPANRNGPEARTKETKFFFCSSLTFISIVKIEFFFLFIFVEQQHKTKTNFAVLQNQNELGLAFTLKRQ
ncbi:hypothetical protein BLOT_000100 [Blomia tropicalis]|nr:hypothetical protein BLOT_000100 [Blomia tropicalis]